LLKCVSAAALAVALCASARASETITYTYDALGRVTGVAHAGSVNNALQSAITYDAAGNRSNYTITGGATVPSLSIADASVTEGGNLVFTVTRAGATGIAISVNYATANGTAVAGSDYTAASGTLTFAVGETSKTITVATTDDTAVESNETLTIALSNPTSGATLNRTTATGTIIDNDATPISFAISNAAAVVEGGTLAYTVTKSGTTGLPISVNYATANGSATAGSDYTATSGTLTFAANETSKTISVATINDSAPEPSETVLVNLSGATGGATISAAQGTGTITDNDVTPITFAVGNAAAVTEGGTLVFTVTKSGSTYVSTSVNYATANGTAAAGSDYNATSGTLTFGPSETTKTVSVATIDDSIHESAETVLINLSSASGGAISTSQGSGTINDNDAAAQPPVANPDSWTVQRCGTLSHNVVANDTDPGGNYPLSVVSVSGAGFSVASSTSVTYHDVGTSGGLRNGSYVVQNSAGVQATGSITITVPNGVCSNAVPGQQF